MDDPIYHVECPHCGAWREARVLRENVCPVCENRLPDLSEAERLLEEVRYYAGQYEQRRRTALLVTQAGMVLVAALGILTLVAGEWRGLFMTAALVYSSFALSLFIRPSYLIDQNYYSILHNLGDREKVDASLGAILRLSMQTRPYEHLKPRLAAAVELAKHLASNSRLKT